MPVSVGIQPRRHSYAEENTGIGAYTSDPVRPDRRSSVDIGCGGDLVELATRLIVEEALEAESHDALGGEYYEHGAKPGQGYRNSYLVSREILTGIGPVRVRVPRTRGRSRAGRCFRSELLPPYFKKARRVEAVIRWLYLKGISTNDFGEALTALFGESAQGLSAATIARLKSG